MSDVNLTEASRQWATRPDDQRFLTLEDLHRSVMTRRHESWTVAPPVSEIQVRPQTNNGIGLEVYDPTSGADRLLYPTNWSFNQLASFAKAPASYLRQLPAELAAINMQWGLEHSSGREEGLILARSNGSNELRSLTSTSYGRIWDNQVVEAVQAVNARQEGRWQVPAASYATQNPKRATTLYASDRDVFIFLVDPNNPIEVPGKQPLFRGFYTWNSEVGAATFGLTTFLYNYVCDNRTIWGATDIRELRIRHTGGAPERFAREGAQYLARYANETTRPLTVAIQAAINKDLKDELNVKAGDTVETWLQKRGFTKAAAKASVETAVAEEGQARSLWDIVQGVTAYARSVPYTDERIKLESAAGKLMALVA